MIKRYQITILILICAMCLIPAGAFSQERYSLRHKFSTGETARYRATMNAAVKAQALNEGTEHQIPELRASALLDVSQTTSSVSDNAANIVYTLEQVVLNPITLIFANGLTTMIPAPTLPALKGNEQLQLKVEIDQRGRGRIVESPLTRLLPQAQPATTAAGTRASAVVGFEFPERPLAVGESWTVTTDLPLGEYVSKPLTADVTYTLAGIEELNGIRCARIVSNQDVKFSDIALDMKKAVEAGVAAAEKQTSAGAAVELSPEQRQQIRQAPSVIFDSIQFKGNNTFLFSLDKGNLIRGNFEQTISLKVHTVANASAAPVASQSATQPPQNLQAAIELNLSGNVERLAQGTPPLQATSATP